MVKKKVGNNILRVFRAKEDKNDTRELCIENFHSFWPIERVVIEGKKCKKKGKYKLAFLMLKGFGSEFFISLFFFLSLGIRGASRWAN